MASVSPGKAKSNLSQWFELFGLPSFEHILTPTVDGWTVGVGLCVTALGVYGMWAHRRKSQKQAHSVDADPITHLWHASQPTVTVGRASLLHRIRRALGKGSTRGKGEPGTVTASGGPGSGRALPTRRSSFWKWLWYRITGRPRKRRLKNVPDLQRCLDELIRYSGLEFPAKVTAREIGQTNVLLVHLERARHVLDKQGISHPKIEKGLVLENCQEWINVLSRVLARDDVC